MNLRPRQAQGWADCQLSRTLISLAGGAGVPEFTRKRRPSGLTS
jgi:hypothetical protein